MSERFDYESAVWGADSIARGERSIAAFRLREALRALPRQGRVVEVGCGGGRFLRAIAERRPDLALVGIDPSRAALRRAAELAPALELRRSNAGPLPAADGEFDAALLLDVLEHVDDAPAFLAEVARIVRPGGVLHAHVPCEGDVLSPWRWLFGQRGAGGLKRRLAGHVQRFRRGELLELLRGGGFEVERVRYSLHLLGALADVAAFVALARQRANAGENALLRTTGDLLVRPKTGGAAGARSFAFLIRGVDALLWWEARALSRLPSWAVHVTSRRR